MKSFKLLPYSLILFATLCVLSLGGKTKGEDNKFKSESVDYESLENIHNRNITRITYTDNIDELKLSVSPNGKQIAYEGWVNAGKMGIFVISSVSNSPVQILFKDDNINRYPVWHTNGQKVLFTSNKKYDGNVKSKLLSVNKNGLSAISLIPTHNDGEITSLCMNSQSEIIYSQLIQGKEKIQLLNQSSDYRLELTEGTDVNANGDGTKIVFIKKDGDSTTIQTMNKDGTDLMEIPTGLAKVQSPCFNPDSKWITFSGSSVTRKGDKKSENWDIYIVEIGTHKIFQLTSDLADDVSPTWASTGEIFFSSSRFGNFEIMKVNPGAK